MLAGESAMLPGPDEIIRCPSCLGLLRLSTLASGNTLGAELWSDGRLDAPMLPDAPPVALCPCCAAPFWEPSAERVGELHPWRDGEPPAEWIAAPWSVEPGEMDLYAAARVLANADEHAEREIRVWAWWKSNDPYRDAAVPWVPFSERPGEARESLRRLLDLLDTSVDAERMMIAEAWRELGEFDTCVRVLSAPTSSELSVRAAELQDLARRGVERVSPMVMPEPATDPDD
jgi:hypothetical protein